MEDLGELGFWLAVGLIAAAAIIAHGLKEREKERQKHETLRTLLTAEGMPGKNTTDILAYMRERDAAEQKREHDLWVATNAAGRKVLAVLAALATGGVGFLVGVRVSNGMDLKGPIAFTPVAVGLLIAVLVYILIRGKKNVPPPGA